MFVFFSKGSIILFIIIIYILYELIRIRDINVLKFQHTNQIVTVDNVKILHKWRENILSKLLNVFKIYSINYVIVDGNLLSIIRGRDIVHDDDIDIRIDNNDVDKLIKYGKGLEYKDGNLFDYDNDLKWDDRILDKKKLLYNGIQVNLIKVDKLCIKFHIDVVPCLAGSDKWIDFSYPFKRSNRIRHVMYHNNLVNIPDKKSSKFYMINDYGINYLRPDKLIIIIDNVYYCYKRYIYSIINSMCKCYYDRIRKDYLKRNKKLYINKKC